MTNDARAAVTHAGNVTGTGDAVRLAELVAALSLATDLGLGQPQQHIIRQTLIALRVAELEGLSDADLAAIFYVSLLAWVGCVADAHEMGKWFGDDMAVRADSYLVDLTGLPMMRFMLGHVASGSSPIRRLTMIGRFLAGGSKEVERSMASHCEASGDLSLRLGLGPEVRDPLQQAFERWDGKGSPAKLAGTEIARIMRIVHVANDVEALHRIGGVQAAVEMLRSRRGTEFDPDLVDTFCTHADELLTAIDELDGSRSVTREASRSSPPPRPPPSAFRATTSCSYAARRWYTTSASSACPQGSWTTHDG